MNLRVTTAPAVEPVTTAEAKAHLRVTTSQEDALIDRHIASARRSAERILGRSLITQTLTLEVDAYPDSDAALELFRGPVQSITSVKSIEDDGTDTTFSGTNYYLVDSHGRKPRIALKADSSWPSIDIRDENGVEVIYKAGYGDAATDIPEDIIDWILVRIADLYEGRISEETGTIVAKHQWVDSLLEPHRVPAV